MPAVRKGRAPVRHSPSRVLPGEWYAKIRELTFEKVQASHVDALFIRLQQVLSPLVDMLQHGRLNAFFCRTNAAEALLVLETMNPLVSEIHRRKGSLGWLTLRAPAVDEILRVYALLPPTYFIKEDDRRRFQFHMRSLLSVRNLDFSDGPAGQGGRFPPHTCSSFKRERDYPRTDAEALPEHRRKPPARPYGPPAGSLLPGLCLHSPTAGLALPMAPAGNGAAPTVPAAVDAPLRLAGTVESSAPSHQTKSIADPEPLPYAKDLAAAARRASAVNELSRLQFPGLAPCSPQPYPGALAPTARPLPSAAMAQETAGVLQSFLTLADPAAAAAAKVARQARPRALR